MQIVYAGLGAVQGATVPLHSPGAMTVTLQKGDWAAVVTAQCGPIAELVRHSLCVPFLHFSISGKNVAALKPCCDVSGAVAADRSGYPAARALLAKLCELFVWQAFSLRIGMV